jgi:hypothetical protein
MSDYVDVPAFREYEVTLRCVEIYHRTVTIEAEPAQMRWQNYHLPPRPRSHVLPPQLDRPT